ncbi:UvrD-helicase domain-containing protein [Methylicorpusculum oleiharenae]|uniref:ATP-dependent helicase n=1 Tax=Methylicorpusculum oleiharenae TaxID=1338687 RepID=UPI0013578714|nr:ATP-dependent helicase [Methylicorpusculum oleiharenae]MCD2453370.1 UvrD-helicase domain-containing protein [Methylicorpusculum oleiharenae]
MDTWIEIRRNARQLHTKALTATNGDRRANALIDAALQILDLEKSYYAPGTRFGEEVFGSLERTAQVVNVASGQDPEEEQVVIAHEIGHYELHTDPSHEVTISYAGLGGDPVEGAAGKVEGYSSRQRQEVQADVFAGEFLCPADWAREQYVIHGCRPTQIANDLKLPVRLVLNQIIRTLLLPPLREPAKQEPGAKIELDSSQKTAATWDAGALLVDAGPGTGKTRTLVHRIKHCLASGIAPASILALTFSNKAAEEMHERLSAMDAKASVEMWVGTFHSFGLELITRWPSGIGRSPQVKIIDEASALALLEVNLEKLSLNHFQNLYEPAYELTHVLRAISRCKDELISPEEYRREANTSYASALASGNEDAIAAAEKALEIAHIYRVYEEALKDADAVDFGDLVLLASKLIESNKDVQAYISQFKVIHVDEYQDVNLASARMLREICKQGAVPWVVADQRQSIYRFRGAEPSNVTRFPDEFAGKSHSLSTNYRSHAPIVRAFETFSSSMGDGSQRGKWEAFRDVGGSVTMAVAPTVAAEAEYIASQIEQFRELGITYSDQVILARTHLTLARLTVALEHLGVPLLYLGDLFERKEIRDLLSLIALDSEYGNVGLARIAELPEYAVAREDAIKCRHWAEASNISIIEALSRVNEISDISTEGRVGLTRLGDQLKGLEQAPPWIYLTTWLFERSSYLRPLLEANDAASRQKLIAIYQLLKVCGEQYTAGVHDRKRFLARIRRLEALNQDSVFRAVSSEASDIDAVRVLTIHGSKGLEFGAVHLPALATRYMPTTRQGVRCPPPDTLTELLSLSGDHDAEEECLFFVALSRARDYLSLSRAERYAKQNASASKFLDIVRLPNVRFSGSGKSFAPPLMKIPQARRDTYPERELSIYMNCPARYRYEIVEGLRGGRNETPYVQFHRCVYATFGWLESERQAERNVDLAAGLERLQTEWAARGPVGHGFEAYYRDVAERMVRAMAAAITGEVGAYERQEWKVTLGTSVVSVTPDRVIITPEGVVRAQRNRTGKKTKSELDQPLYALLRRGAQQYYPGKQISVETIYLASGDVAGVRQRFLHYWAIRI